MKPITQIDLDRLVDGEISAEQYQQLLLQLEADPAAWKACALTFLEAQAWQQEMQSDLVQFQSVVPAIAHSVAVDHPAVVDSLDPEDQSAVSPTNSIRRSSIQIASFAAALAATFLLAFILGSQFNFSAINQLPGDTQITNNPSPVTQDPVGPSPLEANKSISPESEAINPGENYQPYFVQHFDGENWSRIPLEVRRDRLYDPQLPIDTSFGFSEQSLRQFSEQGFHVETQTGYMPVSLENGDQAMVPVQEVLLQPQSFAIFQ